MNEPIYPSGLLYTAGHEWLRQDGLEAQVGITVFAAEAIGSILSADIPHIGVPLKKGQIFGMLETVKTITELLMPVSGIILEKNPKLQYAPGIVNLDPYDWGWLIKIYVTEPEETAQLFSAEAYKQLI